MSTRLLLLHALSPIHCGTGQSVSGIDLPIAREKATNIPLVPGSSLKGVLRARPEQDKDLHRMVFGPDTQNASDNAGSVQFSDANLVFLPVRSIYGTFAWVTSAYMLRRFLRDAKECEIALPPCKTEPEKTEQALITGAKLAPKDKVILEDLDLAAGENDALRAFAEAFAKLAFEDEAERAHFVDRVCVVHEDVMALLLVSATEITTRISLNADTKTVKEGQLWTEEALPTESLLSGLVLASPVKQKSGAIPEARALLDYVSGLMQPSAIQLGGKATVGRGLCRMRLAARRS